MGFQGLIGFGGGATSLINNTVEDEGGLIFDFDPGRMSGYSDNEELANGFNFVNEGAVSVTNVSQQSTATSCTINGGSCNFKTANGGHLDTNSNQCRITVGNDGSPTAMGGDGGLLDSKSLTICGWFQYNGSGRDVLISRYGTGYPNQFNHIVDPGGQFHFNSNGVSLGSGDRDWDAFGDNVWFHSVWLYNVEDGYMRWYVNGSQVGTNDSGTNSGNGAETTSDTGYAIASRADRFEDLEGKIGYVKLWNKALTAAEVDADYESDKSRYGH